MIKLGKFTSHMHRNNGFQFSNEGTIIFRGTATVGNDCYLRVDKFATWDVGDHFCVTAGYKMTCSNSITFEDDVLIGFDTYMLDTDFHHMTTASSNEYPPSFGPIHIGKGCWIGFGNVILKNTYLPEKCIVASKSMLNKKYNCPPMTLLAGTPAIPKKEGLYLDRSNNAVDFNYIFNKD